MTAKIIKVNQQDWVTLRDLRDSTKWYKEQRDSKFDAALAKETRYYKKLLKGVATSPQPTPKNRFLKVA